MAGIYYCRREISKSIFDKQEYGRGMERQVYLIKRITLWFETTKFQNIKIGERFEMPGDPNIYLKDHYDSGIEGGGMRIFCVSKTRVKPWPRI